LLIVFRQTRILGIALGMIFHFTLSLDFFQHVMDFSSLMFALYFVLLSGPFVENGRRVLFRSRSADSISNELLWARLFIVLSLAIVIVSGLILTPSASEIFLNSRQVLWLAYGAFLVALFFCSAIRSYFRDPSLRSLFGGGTVFMAIPIGLVCLNGMGPYVGFKSRSSFDMYSSLRMEEPMPNHLLLRHSLDILGYQRDLVTIVDSNNSMLRARRNRANYRE
jgi:hypothetical protein